MDVEGGSELDYSVSLDGYLSESGTISMDDQNMEQVVLLYPGSGTSVAEMEGSTEIRVFPNPVSDGFVYVDLPQELAARKLVILNALGIEVFSKEFFNNPPSSEQISISHLRKGIFFLRIETPDLVLTYRFLKL